MLDSDQLRSFLAIVDHGSFTRAAERVNRTQSAVSMHIRRLEEKLGFQLFLKSGRGVELSADGEKLTEFARRIVGLETSALLTISKKGLNDRVRFGIPDDYADPFLPAILTHFLQAQPLVEVNVVCEGSLQLAERVSDGNLDLALVSDWALHMIRFLAHSDTRRSRYAESNSARKYEFSFLGPRDTNVAAHPCRAVGEGAKGAELKWLASAP